jgi:hypothetical protein
MRMTDLLHTFHSKMYIAALKWGGRAAEWLERWTRNRKVASSKPRADKVQICRSAPEQGHCS